MGYCEKHSAQKGYAIYARFNRSIISLCFSPFFVDKIEKNRLKLCTDNRKPEFIPPPEIKCP